MPTTTFDELSLKIDPIVLDIGPEDPAPEVASDTPAPSAAQLISDFLTKYAKGLSYTELRDGGTKTVLAIRQDPTAPKGAASVVPAAGVVVLGGVNPKIHTMDPITRPNGQLYYPRLVTVNDFTDWDVRILQESYKAGLPVLLFGVPGTGKTAMCEAAFVGLETVQGSGETEVGDFIGSWAPGSKPGDYIWAEGPQLVAARDGKPLLVDEIALIDPKVLAVLYPTMDGRKVLKVPQNPLIGEVAVADGFYVVGACNPDVPGAVMSDALLSRFPVQIEVTTDFNLARKLGISKEIITVAKNLARRAENNDIMRAPQMRELIAFTKLEATFGVKVALSNMVSCAEPNDRKVIADVLGTTFGLKVEAFKI